MDLPPEDMALSASDDDSPPREKRTRFFGKFRAQRNPSNPAECVFVMGLPAPPGKSSYTELTFEPGTFEQPKANDQDTSLDLLTQNIMPSTSANSGYNQLQSGEIGKPWQVASPTSLYEDISLSFSSQPEFDLGVLVAQLERERNAFQQHTEIHVKKNEITLLQIKKHRLERKRKRRALAEVVPSVE